ncbi:MAG: hypothetical protein LAT84_12405 [Balneolia bacterium]|nr:hypothetical protein [Balneolia bacterium]
MIENETAIIGFNMEGGHFTSFEFLYTSLDDAGGLGVKLGYLFSLAGDDFGGIYVEPKLGGR